MEVLLYILAVFVLFVIYEGIQYIRARSRLEKSKENYFAMKERLASKWCKCVKPQTVGIDSYCYRCCKHKNPEI